MYYKIGKSKHMNSKSFRRDFILHWMNERYNLYKFRISWHCILFVLNPVFQSNQNNVNEWDLPDHLNRTIFISVLCSRYCSKWSIYKSERLILVSILFLVFLHTFKKVSFWKFILKPTKKRGERDREIALIGYYFYIALQMALYQEHSPMKYGIPFLDEPMRFDINKSQNCVIVSQPLVSQSPFSQTVVYESTCFMNVNLELSKQNWILLFWLNSLRFLQMDLLFPTDEPCNWLSIFHAPRQLEITKSVTIFFS